MLKNLDDKLPEYAVLQIGLGDVSVIDAYSDYISRAPGVSVRIWSLDHHLSAYRHEATGSVEGKGGSC